MGSTDDVGPRRVHLRVDGERSGVERPVALDDRPVVADQEKVTDLDVAEVHAERIHPEVIRALGIASGDVSGDALVEAEPTEETERGRQVLLAMQSFLFDRAIGWHQGRSVAAGERLGLL